MIRLNVIDNAHRHFLVAADEPIRIEFSAEPALDGHVIAHVYRGTEIDMDQSPVGAYDSAIGHLNEGWLDVSNWGAMSAPVRDVVDFMTLAGQTVRDIPTALSPHGDERFHLRHTSRDLHVVAKDLTTEDTSEVGLRARLMCEELAETLEAMEKKDLVGIADGLTDLMYVVIGTAAAYGIPLAETWAEVQRSNMGKAQIVDGKPTMVRDAGGKVVKPEGWTPPDLKRILLQATYPKSIAQVIEENTLRPSDGGQSDVAPGGGR